MISYGESSHYYYPSGTPCHEIDGKPTTLRHARKLCLYPSVNTILDILAKPGLEIWKQNNMLMSALTHPEVGSKAPDEVISEVIEQAQQFSGDAAALGTRLHKVIEEVIRKSQEGVTVQYDDPTEAATAAKVYEFLEKYRIDGHIEIERTFACPAGYGGTVDFHGEVQGPDDFMFRETVIDWKTQKTDNGFKSYRTWPAALAAYAHGIGYESARLMNVVFSTTEPGKMWIKEWDEGQEYWYQQFLRVFEVYKGPLGKNYDPLEVTR